MRIIAIGDLHGKDCWKTIDISKYDRVIFLGDYVDDPDISQERMIDNLEQILDLKKCHFDKVVLLLGNHDIHYLDFPHTPCRGFDPVIQPDLTLLYQTHRQFFQIAWQHDHWLFTHAGLSKKYFEWLMGCFSTKGFVPTGSIADILNSVHKAYPEFIFACGVRRGGFYPHGGPLWADITETKFDCLSDLHQVAGHNRVTEFTKVRAKGYDDASITYIDVLHHHVQFYELTV